MDGLQELERIASYVAEHGDDDTANFVPPDTTANQMRAHKYGIGLHHAHQVPFSSAAAQGESRVTGHSLRQRFLVKLEGLLSTSEQIRIITEQVLLPRLVKGEGEDEDDSAYFCHINGAEVAKIERWLAGYAAASKASIQFKPTFVRLIQAIKDFDDTSARPTLGMDTTMPQHRPSDATTTFRPLQRQSPVRYFFYGTLTEPDVLARQLGLSPEDIAPILRRASISGGILTAWDRYRALVDGPTESIVLGFSYEVASKEHEECLMAYEGEKYEVVRCRIKLLDEDGREDWGCTFRFIAGALLV